MSISQTGAGPVTRHEPRVTFGVTRWLSYRVRSLPVTHALPTASLRDSPGSGTQDGAEGGGERGGEGGEVGQLARCPSPRLRPAGCSSNTV